MDQTVPPTPYTGLDSRAYWRSGVVDQHPLAMADLYRKKFDIAVDDAIATAGSCFAQHIANHLRSSGYSVLDVEPPPPHISAATAKKYGFGLYSARYGNIYTTRQLKQLVLEALGQFSPQAAVWRKGERWIDALRPSVEPEGLGSPDLVQEHRDNHLRRVKKMLLDMRVFIFTLGLTETWEHIESATVYPTAPGVMAGTFDARAFRFKNLTFSEVLQDILDVRDLLKAINPAVRFIVTVSPVPLTATASGDHVLPATTYSKSVLRAVAGELCQRFDDVDYFPSYEIIAGHQARGFFYDGNLRTVNDGGVNVVMKSFFSQHKPADPVVPTDADQPESEELVCEEALLRAFG